MHMTSKRLPDDTNIRPFYKIVILGDGGVGKSALTIQYFQRLFLEEHDPTIEDSYIQNQQIDNEWCVLDVLDTAGQEEFSAMREQYMRKGQGFIIVYSVTDPQSFNQVRRFHTQILQCKNCNTFPIILAANKIDLVQQRKVSEEEGQCLANDLEVPYIETSAKDPPVNVDKMFHDMVRIIRRQPPPPPLASKGERKKVHCLLL
ncbi:Ras-related protein isoform 1 [Schistosoma japonicum]|uniref:Ras-related protein isoform 1 n=1 Tax=Schistosoma japonicum TaxID=6182 RepID=Q5DF30_SCHJA|nr:SJCHGC06290 protein [Schistosoma japonicum]KAH8877796.1 Ras-related protein M-Ras [Schistosoma japonicum]TNN05368.1 Ras-related protein isoform 1 [Schistosoma japonicum]